jgi:predicted nucleic acid-binding protein
MTFVDSSFWIALTLRRDPRHEQAVSLLRAHGDGPLLTSNHVRGETWTFLNRKDGHAVASRFLERIDRWQRLTIMFVAEQVERDALRWLRRHDEREYSFVDATSFALMRSLKIREALAFDSDFAAAGFVELRP